MFRPAAGLACVTQGAGYATPMLGPIIDAVGGLVCYLACTAVKVRFGYDDSLDVFGVHAAVAGTLGAVLTWLLRHPPGPTASSWACWKAGRC